MTENNKSKMQNFMIQKNIKDQSSSSSSQNDNDSGLPNKEKPINKNASGISEDAERYLLLAKIINFGARQL